MPSQAFYFLPIFTVAIAKTSSTPTPGPWGAFSEKWYCDGKPAVAAENGRGIILTTISHSGQGNYDGQLGNPLADARLMAAAPDLLEAAKEALMILSEIQCDLEDDKGEANCICLLEEAIAKAEVDL